MSMGGINYICFYFPLKTWLKIIAIFLWIYAFNTTILNFILHVHIMS
jgi:hypothetical protein